MVILGTSASRNWGADTHFIDEPAEASDATNLMLRIGEPMSLSRGRRARAGLVEDREQHCDFRKRGDER